MSEGVECMVSSECVVSMCGEEGELLPICATNGHRMHRACIEGWVRNKEDPNCPACRDKYLTTMKQIFVTTPYQHRPLSPGPIPQELMMADDTIDISSYMHLAAAIQQLSQHPPPPRRRIPYGIPPSRIGTRIGGR